MNKKIENDEPSCLSFKDKNYEKWFYLMVNYLQTTAFYSSQRDLNLKNWMNYNWGIKKIKGEN